MSLNEHEAPNLCPTCLEVTCECPRSRKNADGEVLNEPPTRRRTPREILRDLRKERERLVAEIDKLEGKLLRVDDEIRDRELRRHRKKPSPKIPANVFDEPLTFKTPTSVYTEKGTKWKGKKWQAITRSITKMSR